MLSFSGLESGRFPTRVLGYLDMLQTIAYLDGESFIGMRRHLLETFDIIYILNLQGNSRRKQIQTQGILDENVFDIEQGVAIFLGVKHGNMTPDPRQLARVFYFECLSNRKGQISISSKQ